MSWQILKEPNGGYCIWSPIVEDLLYYNLTEDDVIEIYLEKFGVSGMISAKEVIGRIQINVRAYGDFTLTFDEVMDHRTWKKSKESNK
ncbi:hypothetical protein AB4Z50_14905 [Paenibacillus sp. 2TAB26]|uniref:hypothetical protein n=1 Tax=Paenibacillus sp. 2TAB26 TaxID=3233005 RepID=UPI003F9E2A09